MGNVGGDGAGQMTKKVCFADGRGAGDGAQLGKEWSVSCDKTLAMLYDMGYDIEISRRAIRERGPSDLTALIDHLTPLGAAEDPAPPLAPGAPVLARLRPNGIVEDRTTLSSTEGANGSSETSARNPAAAAVALFFPGGISELGECSRGGPKHPSPASSESPSLGDCRGKRIMDDSDEEVDLDRWDLDDDDGSDRESSLLRMGFAQDDVTAALDRLGVDCDLNKLANHIMNNTVDLPDPSWKDYEAAGGDLDWLTDSPQQAPTDQELSLFKIMQSMGYSLPLKKISDAIRHCGKLAVEEELVDYLTTDPEFSQVSENKTKVDQLMELSPSSSRAACLRAIDNNPEADIGELLDYLGAESLSDFFVEEEAEEAVQEEAGPERSKALKRKKGLLPLRHLKKGKVAEEEQDEQDDDSVPIIYRNMKGFGIPGEPPLLRHLDVDVAKPPYFYFENVAYMPKNEWSNISRHLFSIAPEYVDSLNFSPCRRPRGYIHNLPLEGREDVLPKLPMTIKELLPHSVEFWPAWDPREKLNTINTQQASEFVRKQIKGPMGAYMRGQQEQPSDAEIKEILQWAKRWNLVWTHPKILAPLSTDEVETCLGFDQHHTRVLYSMVERMKALGNTFQVNTVAYHLSVLRSKYPNGIRVLSLFSGIGGAEVALHKLGIFLKVVVSVEINESARRVLDTWWRTTNQKGTFVHDVTDVKDVDSATLATWVNKYGGFDLIIGGSPCNNLSGNNRCTRVGLEGPVSVAFFEFPRIVKKVRQLMGAYHS